MPTHLNCFLKEIVKKILNKKGVIKKKEDTTPRGRAYQTFEQECKEDKTKK